MGRPKREDTPEIEKEMKSLAKKFINFRESNKLSQRFLAEIIHISRRTIQNIEAGKIIPQQRTLDALEALKAKYEAERKISKRKRRKTEDEGEF
jgi:DNA-binding XRE family transcriptional regulator